MNSVVVAILSFLFSVLPYKTCQSSSPQIVEAPFVYEEYEDSDGKPLFLTPLIESGKIKEARSKAFVRHHEMGDVESYSGYLTVNKKYNSNLFFWFFPAMIYSESAPVILWLQGGPGLTSMFGLFAEHGPFIVTRDDTLIKREFSWYEEHNVIYIDNPVGTGFSFTDNRKGYARSVIQVAKDLYTALKQFFLLFPYLQNNDFFVTGEEYAGKYVIALSHAIKNRNIKAETEINLKGLAIVSGFCDPKNQLLHSDYLHEIRLINLNGKTEFQKYENLTRQYIEKNNFIKAFESYNKLFGAGSSYKLSLFYNLVGLYPDYNYLKANVSNDIYFYSLWRFAWWIAKIDVKYAIHVGNNIFSSYNENVYKYQKKDAMRSVVFLLQDLLEHYKVLIYNGQVSIANSYKLTANYLREMRWSGAKKLANAPKKFLIIDDEFAGYITSADNLMFALVRNAGRMVSADQPKWALDLITRFIRNEEF